MFPSSRRGGARCERLSGSGDTLAPRPLTKMNTHSGNQTPEDSGKRRITRDVEEGHKVDGETRISKPPEAVRDLGAGQGRQRGGKTYKAKR